MINEQENWLVVVDGGQARIFKYVGEYEELQQVMYVSHPHPLTHEHGKDKPGRTFESATILKHSYEPKIDWHEHEKLNFLETISQIIIEYHQKREFKVVTLVCPPHLIGLIYAHNFFCIAVKVCKGLFW